MADETKNPGEKVLSVNPTKTLILKRGVEQGVVRQSFSHGRSKAVVVPRVKRRVEKPSAERMPLSPASAPKPSGVVLRTLTEEERNARARALADARVREAEERRSAEEEARRVAEEEGWRRVRREAFTKSKRLFDARAAEQDAHYRALQDDMLLRGDQLGAIKEAEQRMQQARIAGGRTLYLGELGGLRKIPSLAEFSALTGLSLAWTSVSDLKPLSDLRSLKSLNLCGTQVFDLTPLASLSALEILILWGTKIGDLSALSRLTNLRILDLEGTNISDLQPLARLRSLEKLDLRNTKVSNLSPVSKLSNLSHLRISNTPVGDLSPLTGLGRLVTGAKHDALYGGLLFDGCPIADQDILYLAYEDNPARTVQVINNLRKKSLDELPSDEDLVDDGTLRAALEQRPASHSFFYQDGRIEAQPQASLPMDSKLARDIHDQAKRKVDEGLSRLARTNAPQRILSSLDGMAESLGQNFEDVQPGILLMKFRSLEADVACYDTQEARKELFPDAISMLRDTSSSIEDLMACYPQLAKVEAARLALRLQDIDVPAAQENMAGIRHAAGESELVAPSAVNALAAGELDVRHTTQIIDTQNDDAVVAEAIRKRAAIVAQMLLDYRNFAARVIHKVAIDLGEVSAESWGQAIKALPKGVAKGVEEGTAGLVKGGLAVLVGSLVGPLAGLAVLVASFRPLASKARQFEQKDHSDGSDDQGEATRSI